jgi:CO dehydrogenase/acetyl-CoA synthase epsilon subunit
MEKGQHMSYIIDQEALREDVKEMISNILEIEISIIKQYITENHIDDIIDRMFETEAEEIHRIAEYIKEKMKEK